MGLGIKFWVSISQRSVVVLGRASNLDILLCYYRNPCIAMDPSDTPKWKKQFWFLTWNKAESKVCDFCKSFIDWYSSCSFSHSNTYCNLHELTLVSHYIITYSACSSAYIGSSFNDILNLIRRNRKHPCSEAWYTSDIATLMRYTLLINEEHI